VVAAVGMTSGAADAASIVFSSSTSHAPGEFRVDIWFEDWTRDWSFTSLQFDVEIRTGSLVTADPFQLPNARRFDAAGIPLMDGAGDVGPFDVTSIVGDPVGSVDVRDVLESSDEISIHDLAAQWSAFPVCSGDACTPQGIGIARDRLYLGSFYIHLPNGQLGAGPPVSVALSSIFTGDPFEADPLQRELREHAGVFEIAGLAPEPATLGFIGFAVMLILVPLRISALFKPSIDSLTND